MMPPEVFFPFPNALDERLASEIEAALTDGVQLPFHHHLRGDPGVVHAGCHKVSKPRMRRSG